MYGASIPFSTLIGLTLASITGETGSDEIVFTTTDGRTFRQVHHQDCCESVSVNDITGDLADLIGSPILVAEESSSSADDSVGEYGTWTFYKLATVTGWVDIRWLGESNGYYSESVDFEETTRAPN
jgi:hypothetical protein